MRSSARVAWRVAATVAFAGTAALAVTLSRGPSLDASLAARDGTGHSASIGRDMRQCSGASLRIRLSGTARTVRYAVEFTNVSAAACMLSGYPAVTAYGPHGTQVGNAADRDRSAAVSRVVLAPGASAHAAVDAAAAAYPVHACRPVTAAGLHVTPPGAATGWYVRQLLTACSASGRHAPVFLRVLAVQAGAGAAPQR
jgi:Protein of unknown function (DUF4232)